MRALIKLLWIAVILGLIYILSIGPSSLLEEKKFISKTSFEFVYSPLESVAKKSEPADKGLKAYIRFWKKEGKPLTPATNKDL